MNGILNIAVLVSAVAFSCSNSPEQKNDESSEADSRSTENSSQKKKIAEDKTLHTKVTDPHELPDEIPEKNASGENQCDLAVDPISGNPRGSYLMENLITEIDGQKIKVTGLIIDPKVCQKAVPPRKELVCIASSSGNAGPMYYWGSEREKECLAVSKH